MSCNRISSRMWLALYKNLMKEAKQFASYNHREYAKRRIRDHFRSQKNVTSLNDAQLGQLYQKGQASLESLKRQVVLSRLYAGPKLVIESPRFKIPE